MTQSLARLPEKEQKFVKDTLRALQEFEQSSMRFLITYFWKSVAMYVAKNTPLSPAIEAASFMWYWRQGP